MASLLLAEERTVLLSVHPGQHQVNRRKDDGHLESISVDPYVVADDVDQHRGQQDQSESGVSHRENQDSTGSLGCEDQGHHEPARTNSGPELCLCFGVGRFSTTHLEEVEEVVESHRRKELTVEYGQSCNPLRGSRFACFHRASFLHGCCSP